MAYFLTWKLSIEPTWPPTFPWVILSRSVWDQTESLQGLIIRRSVVRLTKCSLLWINLRMFQGRSLWLKGSRNSVEPDFEKAAHRNRWHRLKTHKRFIFVCFIAWLAPRRKQVWNNFTHLQKLRIGQILAAKTRRNSSIQLSSYKCWMIGKWLGLKHLSKVI